jgi:putative DNA primase/helicase
MIFNLCNRPLPASNISAAAIFRVIGEVCPSLILDEADSYMKEDEAMRGIINSGHERQFAWVLRVIDDKGNVGQFPTWCPKAIAMIGAPRRTILSRAIRIAIERKDKTTKLKKLRRNSFAQLEDLRRKISKAASMIREAVRDGAVADDTLGNRASDNWEPLLAIASAVSEQWLKNAASDAESMHDKTTHDAKSFNKYLLESLGRIIAEKKTLEPGSQGAPDDPNKFFLRTIDDLLNKLNGDQEAPWKEKPHDELTAHKLGRILTGFGVSSEQVRRPGEKGNAPRGYWSDALEKVIKQYE